MSRGSEKSPSSRSPHKITQPRVKINYAEKLLAQAAAAAAVAQQTAAAAAAQAASRGLPPPAVPANNTLATALEVVDLLMQHQPQVCGSGRWQNRGLMLVNSNMLAFALVVPRSISILPHVDLANPPPPQRRWSLAAPPCWLRWWSRCSSRAASAWCSCSAQSRAGSTPCSHCPRRRPSRRRRCVLVYGGVVYDGVSQEFAGGITPTQKSQFVTSHERRWCRRACTSTWCPASQQAATKRWCCRCVSAGGLGF